MVVAKKIPARLPKAGLVNKAKRTPSTTATGRTSRERMRNSWEVSRLMMESDEILHLLRSSQRPAVTVCLGTTPA